jgi:hypothetical protein
MDIDPQEARRITIAEELAQHVGLRALRDRFELDAADAMERLVKADATDTKAIVQLQMRVQKWRDLADEIDALMKEGGMTAAVSDQRDDGGENYGGQDL